MGSIENGNIMLVPDTDESLDDSVSVIARVDFICVGFMSEIIKLYGYPLIFITFCALVVIVPVKRGGGILNGQYDLYAATMTDCWLETQLQTLQ